MGNFDKFLFSETFKLLSISVLRILCACVRFSLVVCVPWQDGESKSPQRPCIGHCGDFEGIISTCTVEITQYALKGQKLLAQGIALGNYGHKLVAL